MFFGTFATFISLMISGIVTPISQTPTEVRAKVDKIQCYTFYINGYNVTENWSSTDTDLDDITTEVESTYTNPSNTYSADLVYSDVTFVTDNIDFDNNAIVNSFEFLFVRETYTLIQRGQDTFRENIQYQPFAVFSLSRDYLASTYTCRFGFCGGANLNLNTFAIHDATNITTPRLESSSCGLNQKNLFGSVSWQYFCKYKNINFYNVTFTQSFYGTGTLDTSLNLATYFDMSYIEFSCSYIPIDEDAYNQYMGYFNGLDSTYDNGFDAGYSEGKNAVSGTPYTFKNLFGAIADTPIMILRQLLGFEVFGIDAMAIFMSMVTATIVLYVLKKVVF